MTQYQRIVFMQGEEAEEALRILDEAGEEQAMDYLAQWDNGDGGGEVTDEPASGDDDDVCEAGGYRMSYNTRLGYIGLELILPR